MKSPAQRCARIVAAFEDLAAQEEASLRARDFEAIDSLQERLSAIVEDLVAHAAGLRDERLQARIAAAQSRRDRSSEWLAEELARVGGELRETEVSQRRVARIAPAYSEAGGAARPRSHSQLSAVG